MNAFYFFTSQMLFWLATAWVAVTLCCWGVLRAGRRGFMVSAVWPIWLPLWLLVRMHYALAHVVGWTDFAAISHWQMWGRDFIILAARGRVDKTILTEDPAERLLRLASEHARAQLPEPPEHFSATRH